MRTTLENLVKIPLYKSFRSCGFPKMLPMNYTLLISTMCNSRCKTCNIWKQRHNDLKIDEWKKVFKSIGTSPFWVTVSGGEPFLQKHLADMVISLDRICKPSIVNIPTNSLFPDNVKNQVIKILKNTKIPRLIVNLSLDGKGKEHDRIRGIPGNFEKVMQNYKNLKKIQEDYPNFTIGFHSVISNFNIGSIKELIDFAFELEPDQYLTEIAENRVELDTVGLPITPSYQNYSRIVDYLIMKMDKYSYKKFGRFTKAFRMEYYQFVKNWLKKKKLLPDFAGFASCEIASWGEVWPSCIKGENLGNLRKVNYDFNKVWFSKKANDIRKEIKEKGTSYPLANAFYSSSFNHIPTLLKVLKNIITN